MKTKSRTTNRRSWQVLLAVVSSAGLIAGTAVGQTTLAEFQFNEGSGKTTVSPTNNLTGVLGTEADPGDIPVSVTDTPSGTAGDLAVQLLNDSFLLVDDSVSPILNVRTEALTLEAWVKHDVAFPRQYEGIMAYGSSYKLGLNNGAILFTLFGVVDVDSGLILPGDSAWHHVAAAWEPGVGVTFYYDGFPSFVAETGAMRDFQNNRFSIGAEGLGNSIQATLDRVRVHKGLLTADQLDSVAATPKAPLSNTLVSYGFNQTAMPYQNEASTARPTMVGAEYLADATTPKFVKDSPTGGSTDYCLDFSTAGMRVLVPDPNRAISLDPADSSFTIQAWVKFGAQPDVRSILFSNNGPGGALSFSVASRKVFVTTYGILDIPSNAAIPDDGQWHHVAVVHEAGKEMRFYVDGILGDTIAYPGGVNIDVRTDDHFWLGGEDWGGGTMGYSYVGKMDRFIVSRGIVAADKLDFRAIPGVDPEAPALSIQNAIEISWPTLPAGYKLQSTTDVTDPNTWTDVTDAPYMVGAKYLYYAPVTQTKTFYRLIKQ